MIMDDGLYHGGSGSGGGDGDDNADASTYGVLADKGVWFSV